MSHRIEINVKKITKKIENLWDNRVTCIFIPNDYRPAFTIYTIINYCSVL